MHKVYLFSSFTLKKTRNWCYTGWKSASFFFETCHLVFIFSVWSSCAAVLGWSRSCWRLHDLHERELRQDRKITSSQLSPFVAQAFFCAFLMTGQNHLFTKRDDLQRILEIVEMFSRMKTFWLQLRETFTQRFHVKTENFCNDWFFVYMTAALRQSNSLRTALTVELFENATSPWKRENVACSAAAAPAHNRRSQRLFLVCSAEGTQHENRLREVLPFPWRQKEKIQKWCVLTWSVVCK